VAGFGVVPLAGLAPVEVGAPAVGAVAMARWEELVPGHGWTS